MLADVPPAIEAPAPFVAGGLEACAQMAAAFRSRASDPRVAMEFGLDGVTAQNMLLPLAGRSLDRNFLTLVLDRPDQAGRAAETARFQQCLSGDHPRCEVEGPAAIVIGFKDKAEEFRLPNGAAVTLGLINNTWLTCEAPWAPRVDGMKD